MYTNRIDLKGLTMFDDPLKGARPTADSEWGQNRMLARALLIKSRNYRFIALVSALIGVAVLASLFFKHIDGQLLTALRDPSIIAMITVPFLPAIVFSLIAQKTEREFAKLGRSSAAAAEKPATKTTPAKK